MGTLQRSCKGNTSFSRANEVLPWLCYQPSPAATAGDCFVAYFSFEHRPKHYRQFCVILRFLLLINTSQSWWTCRWWSWTGRESMKSKTWSDWRTILEQQHGNSCNQKGLMWNLWEQTSIKQTKTLIRQWNAPSVNNVSEFLCRLGLVR